MPRGLSTPPTRAPVCVLGKVLSLWRNGPLAHIPSLSSPRREKDPRRLATRPAEMTMSLSLPMSAAWTAPG